MPGARAAPLLLAVAALLLAIAAYAGSWSLVGSSFAGNGPGGAVVPGGEASLSVSLAYSGASTASNVSICLVGVPAGFSLAPGEPVCVEAGSVAPGGVASASWRLLVSRSTAPGSYSFTVEARYSVNGTPGAESFTVTGVVSEPPVPRLEVVESYWAGGGYPGGAGDLVLVLENRGPGDVAGGVLEARLPAGFSPSTVSVALPPVPEGGLATVTLTGISVGEDVPPGSYIASYTARLTVDAGTVYTVNESGVFQVEVSEPPSRVVELVDYGLSPAGVGGPEAAGESLYLVLRVARPGATVRHVYAYATLEGATSINGSSRVFTAVTGAYGYGDSIVVELGPLRVEASTVEASVELLVHVEEQGSSYWVRTRYSLTVDAAQPGPLVLAVLRWSGGAAYPGSEAAVEAVLVNRGATALLVENAVLETPWGVSAPQGPVEVPPGGAAVLRFPVAVPRDASPGSYVFALRVSATALSSGAAGAASYMFRATLRVLEPPGPGLELVSAGWSWGGPGCPLTRGARVEAVLRVSEPGLAVRSVRAWLEPGPGALVEGPAAAETVDTGLGGLVRLVFTGVGAAAEPGSMVPLVLHVEALLEDAGGAEYWVNASYPVALPIYREPPLRLVDSWLEPPAGSGGYASLAVMLQWLYPYADASSVEARLEGLEGARALPGASAASTRTAVGYGGAVVLRLGPLELLRPDVAARVVVAGYAGLPGGGWCGYSLEERVEASKTRLPLGLLGLETRRGGSPAPLLPGSWGVEARLVLLNPGPWSIEAAVNESATLLPPGVRLLSASGCTAQPGGVCSVSLVLAVDEDAKPGVYNATVALVATTSSGSGVSLEPVELSVPLAVADPVDYAARLVVAAAYWGSPGSPAPWAYSGTGPAELTVVLLNRGPWTAHGVVVEAPGLLVDRAACAAAVEPGGFCSARLVADLRGVEPGLLRLGLRIAQVLSGHGSSATVEEDAEAVLRVEPQPLGGGLAVSRTGWANGWIALPGDNATLEVVLVNRWQLPVYGVEAELVLPWGGAGGHLDGPIAPGASAVLRIPVDIPRGVEPGVYEARLRLSYVVGQGSSSVPAGSEHNVSITVWSPWRVFSVASVEWLETGRSGSPGLMLRVVLRNDHAAAARGPVLEAVLPPSYYYAPTASRLLVAAPGGPQQGIQLPGASAAGVEELARRLAEAGSAAVPQGGFVEYALRLGAVDATKPLVFNATVVFVDHWGSVVEAHVRVEAPAPAAPRLEPVAVEPASVRIVNGTAKVKLVVRNTGEAEALDAEAIIAPRVPLLLPLQARVRLPPIPPGGTAEAEVTLIYSPGGTSIFGSEGPSYTSVPFSVALLYRDRTGHLYVYNTTLSVLLEPLIRITLLEAKAEAGNGTITVGGVVANQGTAAARSVTVEAAAGREKAASFLGDIEAAGQAAFRLDLSDNGADEVLVRIRYLDNYGAEHAVTYHLPVQRHASAAPQASAAAPGEEGGPSIPVMPVAAGVSGFLAAAAFMIARFLRRAEARLGGG